MRMYLLWLADCDLVWEQVIVSLHLHPHCAEGQPLHQEDSWAEMRLTQRYLT